MSGQRPRVLCNRRLFVLALLVAFWLLGAALEPSGHGVRARADALDTGARAGPGLTAAGTQPARVRFAIGADAPLTRVPRSFFGFSTEYWTLGLDARHQALYRRLVSLVHVPGDGPFVLRIGGRSSDHAYWRPAMRHHPHWGFALTPRWITQTARLVNAADLNVILDLNLITGDPALARAWAHAALSGLPADRVIAFEVGNEPDLYSRRFWRDETRRGRAYTTLPAAVTPSSYARAYTADAAALTGAAGQVPLLGPALGGTRRAQRWVATLLAGPRPRLGAVSVHQYPFSACTQRRSLSHPTIARLLSQRASAGLAAAIRPTLALARSAALPVRVTEFNSVTCGGLPGVSESFATALWAPDALFELAHIGVASADLHVRGFSDNTPFEFTRDGVRVRPLLYGLILFTRTLGPDARLITTPRSTPATPHIKIWAVRIRARGLHVLVLNKSPRPVIVTLRLPARTPARVQRLLAPSATSTTGQTLAGQHLDSRLRWHGPRTTTVLYPRHTTYRLAVPGLSAALMSVSVNPGALTSPTPHPQPSAVMANTDSAPAGLAGQRQTGAHRDNTSAREPAQIPICCPRALGDAGRDRGRDRRGGARGRLRVSQPPVERCAGDELDEPGGDDGARRRPAAEHRVRAHR